MNSLQPEGNTCVTCSKKEHSLFNSLEDEELMVLENSRTIVSYKKGEIIYKEGSKPVGLLCLNHGKVKISKTGIDGEERIISLHQAIDFIGFQELLQGRVHTSSAIAIEECFLCCIEKEAIIKVIKENPNFAMDVINNLAADITNSNNQYFFLNQKHMRARMAHILLSLHKKFKKSKDNCVLNIELKRSELAALASMTTSNAIRTLSDFKKERLIEVDKRKIILKNIPDLKMVSESYG